MLKRKLILNFLFELIKIRGVLHNMRMIICLALMIVEISTFAQSGKQEILCVRLYNADNFSNPLLDSTLRSEQIGITYLDSLPSFYDFDSTLHDYDQLWLVSDFKKHLDSSYLLVIESFLEEGKSLYVLADNEPYLADAEFVSNYFAGAHFSGNYMADKGAKAASECDLATSRNTLYEGFTVSSISMPESVKPQFVGSEGQVFVASFDNGRYRILMDGGFTRMYTKWDDQSAQYFLNAANWLSR